MGETAVRRGTRARALLDSWLDLPVALARQAVPMDGFVHPDFLPVARVMRRLLHTRPGGAAVCVYHRGECVVDLWGGYRDDAGSRWRRDTMATGFSTTKGVASTLAHMMVDRGLLEYDAPVARYWPEFARAGKERITVRHVLAHQAGLFHIRRMVDHADRMLDWEYMARALEQAAPAHPPGARTAYHGLTYGFLVGELVRRVSGRPFSQLAREEIAEPLGLDGFYVGTPPHELERAARLLWPRRITVGRDFARRRGAAIGERVHGSARLVQRALDLARVRLDLPSIVDALGPHGISSFDFGSEATLQAVIPAVNGVFTARSLARMYAALAGGGSLDGVRLMSAATIARATERHTAPGGRLVIPFDMRWRLGYHGVFTTHGVPKHAFGHFGFGGSGGWAEPRRELAVALMVNSGIGTPFGDFRIVRIGGVTLGCADRRAAAGRRASTTLPWTEASLLLARGGM